MKQHLGTVAAFQGVLYGVKLNVFFKVKYAMSACN